MSWKHFVKRIVAVEGDVVEAERGCCTKRIRGRIRDGDAGGRRVRLPSGTQHREIYIDAGDGGAGTRMRRVNRGITV